MGYKYKPQKAVTKRFKVTATGKLKHRKTFRGHLMSNRSGDQKRHSSRPAILAEGHSRNLRRFIGVSKLKPRQIAHFRELARRQAVAAQTGTAD